MSVLDGNRCFLQVVADAWFPASTGIAPPMIVVSVPNANRDRDLSPPMITTSDLKEQPLGGGADRFHGFLVSE